VLLESLDEGPEAPPAHDGGRGAAPVHITLGKDGRVQLANREPARRAGAEVRGARNVDGAAAAGRNAEPRIAVEVDCAPWAASLCAGISGARRRVHRSMEPGVTVLSCANFGTADAVFSILLTTTLGLALAGLSIFDAWHTATAATSTTKAIGV